MNISSLFTSISSDSVLTSSSSSTEASKLSKLFGTIREVSLRVNADDKFSFTAATSKGYALQINGVNWNVVNKNLNYFVDKIDGIVKKFYEKTSQNRAERKFKGHTIVAIRDPKNKRHLTINMK